MFLQGVNVIQQYSNILQGFEMNLFSRTNKRKWTIWARKFHCSVIKGHFNRQMQQT